MPIAMIIMVVIAVAMMAASLLLMPKPPSTSASAASGPTAQSGMPMPVIAGSVIVKSPNCLGWWDNQINRFKEKV
jgi:hypothetical protein